MRVLTSLLFIFYSLNASATPVMRVISLSPALTEMFYALHLESHLVGVTEFSDEPAAARLLPRVGPYTNPSFEKIISLKPNLIFLSSEGPQDVELELKKLGLPYKVVSTRSLSEIGASALAIATAMGKKETGTNFLKSWTAALNLHPKNSSTKQSTSPGRAIVALQHDPIFVAASDTYLDEMLNRCGTENSFSSKTGHIKVSLESIIQKAPQFILLVGHFSNVAAKSEAIGFWKKYLPKSRVIVLDEHLVGRPGPRLLQGLTQMCDALGANRI